MDAGLEGTERLRQHDLRGDEDALESRTPGGAGARIAQCGRELPASGVQRGGEVAVGGVIGLSIGDTPVISAETVGTGVRGGSTDGASDACGAAAAPPFTAAA